MIEFDLEHIKGSPSKSARIWLGRSRGTSALAVTPFGRFMANSYKWPRNTQEPRHFLHDILSPLSIGSPGLLISSKRGEQTAWCGKGSAPERRQVLRPSGCTKQNCLQLDLLELFANRLPVPESRGFVKYQEYIAQIGCKSRRSSAEVCL